MLLNLMYCIIGNVVKLNRLLNINIWGQTFIFIKSASPVIIKQIICLRLSFTNTVDLITLTFICTSHGRMDNQASMMNNAYCDNWTTCHQNWIQWRGVSVYYSGYHHIILGHRNMHQTRSTSSVQATNWPGTDQGLTNTVVTSLITTRQQNHYTCIKTTL